MNDTVSPAPSSSEPITPPPGVDAATAVLDYKVSLENFYGPLDLLLHLVKEREMEIETISVAHIAEQYCTYLDMMKALDINLAGEFLVMAASLMALKARALVPREAIEEEAEEDPSLDLIRKLIEYKRFKERARLLAALAEIRAQRFARGVAERPGASSAPVEAPEPEPLKDLELWPLVSNFARLTRQLRLDVPMSILYADVPIERFMEMVLERLRDAGSLPFTELAGKTDTMRVIGTFLAVLQLAKDQRVAVEQEEGTEEIRIVLNKGDREPPVPPEAAPADSTPPSDGPPAEPAPAISAEASPSEAPAPPATGTIDPPAAPAAG